MYKLPTSIEYRGPSIWQMDSDSYRNLQRLSCKPTNVPVDNSREDNKRLGDER